METFPFFVSRGFKQSLDGPILCKILFVSDELPRMMKVHFLLLLAPFCVQSQYQPFVMSQRPLVTD